MTTGGLVQQQQRRVRSDGARDRHQLAPRGAERRKIRGQIQLEPDLGGDFGRACPYARGTRVQSEAAAAQLIEDQILGDAQARSAQLVRALVDDDDARFTSGSGRVQREGPAVHFQCSGVWPQHAGADLGERRFAGAIGAEQRQNLAPPHRQIDFVERDRRSEAFADAARLDGCLVNPRSFARGCRGQWSSSACGADGVSEPRERPIDIGSWDQSIKIIYL
jgi:hypothetical protein